MNPRTRDEFIAAYNKLNNSKKGGTFHYATARRGFGSSVNLAVLAMLFCLYSDRKLHVAGDLLDDFFEPIYEKTLWTILHRFVWTFKVYIDVLRFLVRHRYKLYVHKLKFAIEQTLQMVKKSKRSRLMGLHNEAMFPSLLDSKLYNHHFKIPELGIDDNFISAFKKVLSRIYVLNDKTQRWVDERNNVLNIPPNYAGVHIRRSDKVNVGEMEQIPTPKYINELQKVAPQIKNVLITTDDYTAFEEFRRECPADWQVVTACDPQNRGRDSEIIAFKKYEFVKMDTLNTIADIELLRGADVFIGTYSSNLSQIVGMLRDEKRCYSLDFQEIIPNRHRSSIYLK